MTEEILKKFIWNTGKFEEQVNTIMLHEKTLKLYNDRMELLDSYDFVFNKNLYSHLSFCNYKRELQTHIDDVKYTLKELKMLLVQIFN